jgi:hypothetical protein
MNKDETVTVLRQIGELLHECRQPNEARTVENGIQTVAGVASQEEWDVVKQELHRATIGMGSLNDLVLRPPAGSQWTKERANMRLGQLADELYSPTKP